MAIDWVMAVDFTIELFVTCKNKRNICCWSWILRAESKVKLPSDQNDQTLDAMVTDKKFFIFKKK